MNYRRSEFWLPAVLGGLIATRFLAPIPAPAAHVRLLVLTGQSNSLGTTAGGEGDPSPGFDASDRRIRFFWHNVANATTTIGTSDGGVTNLVEQQGNFFYPGSATHWGPEMGCARALFRAGARDFGIIKASRGGGGNTHWSKAHGGHMYTHVTATVHQATADLSASGHTFEIVGFMYLQGESDSGGEAAVSGARLDMLIDNLRSDLPSAASMHAVIGGIAAAGTNRDIVRAQQAALAAGDATISYFDTTDLRGGLYDNLHYDKAAKLTVGKRYAEAFAKTGVFERNYGRLVFIGDSITQGGNGHPSYRYEVFKHLATNNASFTFVGSVTGAYANNAGATPDWHGHTFTNHHDGHWGWRSFWENGRVPLPAGRRGGNRGEGTVLNWTGQATQYELNTAGNWVDYPDPAASGTGNTGTTYTPDTAVIMIGINDFGSGSEPTQVRDDIGTLVDQLQAANGNVSVFLSQLLYTNQGQTRRDEVNAVNALLPALASNKTTASSSVFVIDSNAGFDPVTMTYDNVHPNATGEAQVGRQMAEGLGMIVAKTAAEASGYTLTGRDSSTFASRFDGDEIHNGTAYINGWGDFNVTESLTGTGDLRLVNPGAGGVWIDGTASDSSGTTWNDGNDGDWTLEVKLKCNDVDSGFALWLGTDADLVMPTIYTNRTTSHGDRFDIGHGSNVDGGFHVYRVAHDSAGDVYHVWRDGSRLTPVTGVAYDGTQNDSRMLLGDYTSKSFGDRFDVEIAYVRYDLSGAYAPLKAYTKRHVRGFSGGLTHLDALPAGSGQFAPPTGAAWSDPAPGDSLATFDGGGSDIRVDAPRWAPSGSWTAELRLKVADDGGTSSGSATDGFVVWADNGQTGDQSGLLRVRTNSVVWGFNNAAYEDGATTVEILTADNRGELHVVRLGYDSQEQRYWIWRDDTLIGDYLLPVNAVAANWLLFGSHTGSVTAEAEIDYLAFDTTGIYAPEDITGGTVFIIR